MVSAAVFLDNFASSKLDNQDRHPMHEINHTPPERMTPEQRRREIASLLARGLARLRMASLPQPAKILTAREVSLGFSGNQSVHTDPVNNRYSES